MRRTSALCTAGAALALALRRRPAPNDPMNTQALDLLWIVLCAALVFVMQAGFLCLESGLTRNKNSINVAAQNVADFAIAALVYWLVGFGLMFGPTWGGWVGAGLFGLFDQIPNQTGVLAFVLFQLMFCGTATTIVSGTVAERMRFRRLPGHLGPGLAARLPGRRPLGLGQRAARLERALARIARLHRLRRLDGRPLLRRLVRARRRRIRSDRAVDATTQRAGFVRFRAIRSSSRPWAS